MTSKSLIVLAITVSLGSAAAASPDVATDKIACGNPVGEESAAACTRLIAHAPLSEADRFMAYYNRAWAYRRAGRNADALADFDAAASRDNRFAKLYLSRAQTRYEVGQMDGALKDLNRYASLAPDDWRGYFQRAHVLRELRRHSEALKDIERAFKLNRYAGEVGPLQVLTLVDLGRSASALAVARRILAARRSDAAGRYVRAVISFRGGDLHAASDDLDAAIESAPLFPAAYSLKAQIHEARGDEAEALKSYRMAMRTGGVGLDSRTAQTFAESRLAVLSQSIARRAGLRDTTVALADKGASKRVAVRSPLQCRRFIPMAAATISVVCED